MKGSKNTNNARDWTDTETEAWMGLVKAQQLLSRKVEDELKNLYTQCCTTCKKSVSRTFYKWV